MNGNGDQDTRKTASTQEVLDALLGASLDAIQLIACAVRGECTGPQGQDLRRIDPSDQIDLARHLLIHAGPMAEQLRSATDESSAGIR